jgi:hypothetical protein
MDQAITERLSGCYTGVVHDVMRAMGLRDFTLPAEVRPLFPERRLAGPAFTVDGRVDPRADAHETLLWPRDRAAAERVVARLEASAESDGVVLHERRVKGGDGWLVRASGPGFVATDLCAALERSGDLLAVRCLAPVLPVPTNRPTNSFAVEDLAIDSAIS